MMSSFSILDWIVLPIFYPPAVHFGSHLRSRMLYSSYVSGGRFKTDYQVSISNTTTYGLIGPLPLGIVYSISGSMSETSRSSTPLFLSHAMHVIPHTPYRTCGFIRSGEVKAGHMFLRLNSYMRALTDSIVEWSALLFPAASFFGSTKVTTSLRNRTSSLLPTSTPHLFFSPSHLFIYKQLARID